MDKTYNTCHVFFLEFELNLFCLLIVMGKNTKYHILTVQVKKQMELKLCNVSVIIPFTYSATKSENNIISKYIICLECNNSFAYKI